MVCMHHVVCHSFSYKSTGEFKKLDKIRGCMHNYSKMILRHTTTTVLREYLRVEAELVLIIVIQFKLLISQSLSNPSVSTLANNNWSSLTSKDKIYVLQYY